MKLYLNNAATSFPKPNEVKHAILDYMTNVGANPGRGVSSSALESNKLIFNCREIISEFFNFPKTENVIFTPNITASLNTIIKGAAKRGWHVITSSMEHNSVLRPLNSLAQQESIELDILQCNSNGILDLDTFRSAIKSNTKLVILSHSSNIIGSIQPLKEIGQICKNNNIYFVIDSAQTAGVLKLDMKELNCNALCFTGHKSLLAPQGIGGFIIDDTLNEVTSHFIEGGTGSASSDVIQPNFLPDKFESGTMNTLGIAGLLASVKFINSIGLNSIHQHEQELTQKFIDEILNIDSIKLYGFKDASKRTSPVSINSTKIDNAQLGFFLDKDFGIITRTGLHCAPLAHKTIGTYPDGTLRISFGLFNDIKDVMYCVDSLNKILKSLN